MPKEGIQHAVSAVLSIVSSILLGGQFITDLLEDSTPQGALVDRAACLQRALGDWGDNHKEKLLRKRMI